MPEINTILVRLEEVVHTTNNSLDNYFEQVRNAPQDLNYLWPLMQTHLNTQQTFLTRLNELCAQINQLGQ